MNHTPVAVTDIPSTGATTNITTKHRAVIISPSGSTAATAVVTLTFLDKNGANTGNFVIRLVQNSGPFYIPCRVMSASATGNAISILQLA